MVAMLRAPQLSARRSAPDALSQRGARVGSPVQAFSRADSTQGARRQSCKPGLGSLPPSRRADGCRSGAIRPARPLPPCRALPPEVVTLETVFEATGVPLVDELMRMKTVEAAAQHSLKLAVIAMAAAFATSFVLRAAGPAISKRLDGVGRDFNLFGAAVAAAFKPCSALLPWYALSYIVKLGAALAQVAATKKKSDFAALCMGRGDEVMAFLKVFTQLVQDTSEFVLIVIAAWAAINLKNRLVSYAAAVWMADDASAEPTAAVTLLNPLSGVLSVLIYLAAFFTTLGAFGINLGPILASVGGIGVVVGLATQRLLMNVVSAIALYSARPFVVGDEVVFLGGGAPVVKGVIKQIEPMRTLVIDEDGSLVYIDNAEVQNFIVKNLTQGKALATSASA